MQRMKDKIQDTITRKGVVMPAQPTQDTGAAPVGSAVPMSTPTAPSVGAKSGGIKGNSPHRGTHNPENALDPAAYRK